VEDIEAYSPLHNRYAPDMFVKPILVQLQSFAIHEQETEGPSAVHLLFREVCVPTLGAEIEMDESVTLDESEQAAIVLRLQDNLHGSHREVSEECEEEQKGSQDPKD
jgi:hypothetical protein